MLILMSKFQVPFVDGKVEVPGSLVFMMCSRFQVPLC